MTNPKIKALLDAAAAQQLVVVALLQAAEARIEYTDDGESEISSWALRSVREEAEATLSSIEGLLRDLPA
ncbi:hypothetical protein GFK26_18190 [Variovorax paradoxus]|uniref:Uncharacterized protein n=1 Tax=Variovorax paradoxus TaxID=34073 RepID=A0A5Q0M500_VARPD|nr:hypothetical protein [Variovorax paradoxus]QFZ84559.1 hypothetical protein GFK26_18190 [Variovorax paradoxus]